MKIYFVTKNKHKLREVQSLLQDELPNFTIQIAPEHIQKIEIQSDSLEDIVTFAAETLINSFKENFIIEDAGLFIDALKGFPGPYSSYAYRTIGLKGILKLLENIDQRAATFKSCIAFYFKGILKIFSGEVRGTIATVPRGKHGFGFDPIFIPEENKKTFAEMTLKEKNMYSHRARAIRKLILYLKQIL